MDIVWTGASSKLGAQVLSRYLERVPDVRIWCGVHRHPPPLSHPQVKSFPLDLRRRPLLPRGLRPQRCVHFAGITHAADFTAYTEVNLRGTERLAAAVQGAGCERMLYLSTRCIGRGSGAYGDSKRQAEDSLRRLSWRSLTILRPAEVYAADGTEGVDRLVALARKWRIVPMLLGHRNIRFAPVHADDFAEICTRIMTHPEDGEHIHEICGPEEFDGAALARRISQRWGAVPIPIWLPLLAAFVRLAAACGAAPIFPDQIDRLIGEKSAHRPPEMPESKIKWRRFCRDD
ncbi:MAG: NAD-dependent epimerase/dehydratase family protein [Elusimicrobiota bacterium]